MSKGHVSVAVVALIALSTASRGEAEQCGSALLLQVTPPPAIDQVDPSSFIAARFWEAGSGGSNRGDVGCQSGCALVSGPACANGGDCLALTGVSWLNASCASAGHLPTRTVFLVEQTTADSGGRWAAINLDTNAGDANTDIDAKAAIICSDCASVVSPYVGGAGYPEVTASSGSGGFLNATLVWSSPPTVAQALSNGNDVVVSYSVFFRGHEGSPPPATGDPTGWTLVADLEPDGVANGGFSTDTSAEVEVAVPGGVTTATFAIGLNFNGSGDPVADANTLPSSYISNQSEAVAAASLIFEDGFESGDSSAWSATVP